MLHKIKMTLCLYVIENVLCQLSVSVFHNILARSLDTEQLETCRSEVGVGQGEVHPDFGLYTKGISCSKCDSPDVLRWTFSYYKGSHYYVALVLSQWKPEFKIRM